MTKKEQQQQILHQIDALLPAMQLLSVSAQVPLGANNRGARLSYDELAEGYMAAKKIAELERQLIDKKA
jgi:hypothetical protein